jgi:hypothetical protein
MTGSMSRCESRWPDGSLSSTMMPSRTAPGTMKICCRVKMGIELRREEKVGMIASGNEQQPSLRVKLQDVVTHPDKR